MIVLKDLNFFRHPCELCNERGHLNLQCNLFHDKIVSKNRDNLITLEHHKELSLLLGYEEMKRINKGIPKFNLKRFLDFDLEEIYMFCAVNCIENPYIANYLKTRKQLEYEESTNERKIFPNTLLVFIMMNQVTRRSFISNQSLQQEA